MKEKTFQIGTRFTNVSDKMNMGIFTIVDEYTREDIHYWIIGIGNCLVIELNEKLEEKLRRNFIKII